MDMPWMWHHTHKQEGPLELRVIKARTSEGRSAIIPNFSKVHLMSINQQSTPFNVNDKVMFQLNEAGRKEAKKLIDAEQADLKLKKPRVMHMEDWNEMPFWEFASFFGPTFHHGGDMLFDDLELVTDID